MALLYEIRRRARQVAPQVLFAGTLGYFAFHAVEGDRGLIAWAKLQDELARAQSEQAMVAEERSVLEHRVGLLRKEHLDPDMLDERARLLLNYGRADEFVILLPNPQD